MGFTNMGAFFNRIGDSSVGGTYLTALTSFMNFGWMW